MEYTQIAGQIKSAIEGTNGCYTKTTIKKGAGFVPYNRYGLKWGQVDVSESRIRIVLDLYPQRYSISRLSEQLDIPIKRKGERKTGMFIKVTDKPSPSYDALEISLYAEYVFSHSQEKFNKLLEFIRRAAEESVFKSQSTGR